MPSTVTFTGNLGPGDTVTSLAFQNVVEVNFQIAKRIIEVKQSDPVKITHLNYDDSATVTYTITGANAAVVIST